MIPGSFSALAEGCDDDPGPGASLSHGCVVHGPCRLGRDCLVGFRSVAFRAGLANGVFVGSGAVVQGVDLPDRALVPPGSCITSAAAASLGSTGPAERAFIRAVAAANRRLCRGYARLSGARAGGKATPGRR